MVNQTSGERKFLTETEDLEKELEFKEHALTHIIEKKIGFLN
jgi:hypothetical protein